MISRASVIYLLFLSIFLLAIGWINPQLGESGAIIFLLSYCCGLIPLGFLASGWLLWQNRAKLSNIFVWLAFQLIFAIAMAMQLTTQPSIFFLSLLFLLFPSVGFANLLYALQNGASLKLMGWGSIGLMWTILFAWRIKGNLLEAWIASIGTSSNDLWWLHALMYGFGSIVIAGVFAFMIETVQILRSEQVAMQEDKIHQFDSD